MDEDLIRVGPGGRGGLGDGEEILQGVSAGQASLHKGTEARKSSWGGFETLVQVCTRHLCGRLERRGDGLRLWSPGGALRDGKARECD